MWKVTAQGADGNPVAVDSRPLDDGLAAAAASPWIEGREHAYELLERESSSPLLRFVPIDAWALAAAEMVHDLDWTGVPKLEALDGGIARYADPQDRPACVAWHDRGAVLIAVPGDRTTLTVEYVPERLDEQHLKRMLHRHAGPDHALETLLDWRAFVGQHTGIVDGWTLMRQSGRGWSASLVGATGFVVARALRRLTVPEPTLMRDPRMASRLAELEAAHADVADACPRLEEVEPPLDADVAAVFVHGTASCGIGGLRDLVAPTNRGFAVPVPVLRFEHDTFVPIIDNAQDLADQIARRLRVRRLLLLAHSRGGLVAADAARVLRDGGYAGDVTVHSFGTPYRGTPLVAMGKKALNLLMKLGEGLADGVPLPLLSPLAKAMFYVTESPTLPPGILAMQEGAEGLRYIERSAQAVQLRSWGSDYDVLRGDAGYGVATEGFLIGALDGRPHDLVVPATSATACGRAQPLLACAHGLYFRQVAVRTAVADLWRGDAAAALAAAAAGPTMGDVLVRSPKVPRPPAGRYKVDVKRPDAAGPDGDRPSIDRP